MMKNKNLGKLICILVLFLSIIWSCKEETLPKPKEKLKASMQPIIRLEDMVTNLFSRISKSARMSFRSFSGDFAEKKNIIVSFLAVLELVKQQDITVEQDGCYEDITCEATDIKTPKYE